MLWRPTQGLQVGCVGPTCQTVKCNTALNAFMIEDDGKMSTRVIVYAHAAKKGHVFIPNGLCNCITKVNATVDASVSALVLS